MKKLKNWLLNNRKILFPTLSVPGILFFILCDYEYYPWLTSFFVCIFMLYAFWGITRSKRFTVGADSEGNTVMYDKREFEELNHEKEQGHEKN
jgi:Ca2+/Na+ antiporter